MTDTLVRKVADRLAELAPDDGPVLLAISGGADSIAMLHLLAESTTVPLIAAHVDHGIDPESDRPMELVRAAATELGLPFEATHLHLGPAATETAAREARREALIDVADRVGASVIATAHHAGDQAETVLMRVLRGTGPAGLAGILPRHCRWIRPLLDVEPEALRSFLADRGIRWWEDPANRDARHLRSWLRSDLMPQLERRLPDVGDRLRAVADQAGTARRGWDQVLEHLQELEIVAIWRGVAVSLAGLRKLPEELRWQVIGALFRRVGGTGISRPQAVARLIEGGRSGSSVAAADDIQVSVDRNCLVLVRLDEQPWEDQPVVGPGRWELGPVAVSCRIGVVPADQARDGEAAWLASGYYVARRWQSGDRIRPLGGTGSRPVAVLLRERGVSAVLRSRWPVVVPADRSATIVWVPGICRSEENVLAAGEEGWRLDAEWLR